ncbi:MAG: nuclear transport factor 2 family protein [Anaerolineales bacterium]
MQTQRILPILFLLGALVLASCAPAQPAPTAAPTSAPAIPTVEAFLAALNAADVETAASYLAEDAMFTLHLKYQRHLQPIPIGGKEAILAFLQSSEWTNTTIEPRNYADENGRVIFGCKVYSGESLIASGSATTSNGCVIIVRDGLIVFVGDQPQELLYFH